MNFFEHQESARKSSRWLVGLFIVAVLIIIGFLDLIVSGFYLASRERIGMQYADIPLSVHMWVSGSIALLITALSFFRLMEIRAGGYKVAESLGGRRLVQNERLSTEELRLLNIVDEMAIAAGTETPVVYVLEDSAINAFAAGLTTHDAVIGVTRGAIDLLNRDEMQGVIAHEFSHILNGDMRLNLQIIGVLFGITCISYAGHQLTRVGASSRDSAPLVIGGVVIMLIGFIGVFFASLIKAGISRQREYLADASAVQYTRNKFGIAGALKKIGGWSIGSHLAAPKASEYSHFYIADGVSMLARGFFETHPPLKKRIGRIDPEWDGKFPLVKRSPEKIQEHHQRKKQHDAKSFSLNNGPDLSVAALTAAIALTGMPNINHVKYAQNMLEDIPVELLDAIHQPIEAYTLCLLLLLHNDIENWPERIKTINKDMQKVITPIALKFSMQVKTLNVKYRLPLLEMAMPALKELLPEQQRIFKNDVIKVIQSNQKIELWEWSLYRIIRLSLNKPQPAKAKYSNFNAIKDECALILSALNNVGDKHQDEKEIAYFAASSELGLSSKLENRGPLNTSDLKQALDKLAELKPLLKPRFLKALVLSAQSDNKVEAEEVELIRAISESIDCPMPPIIA